MSLLALAFSFGLASSDQRAPVEPAIARVIDAALVDQETLAADWPAVAARLAPLAGLQGTAPSNDDWRSHDRSLYRQSGSISVAGAHGELALCGDEHQVYALTVSMWDLWMGTGDILSELSALGVTAVETERHGPVMPEGADDYDRSLRIGIPDRIIWRLEKPGHADAELLADHICTRPGTRSAPQCWMHFTVRLRPNEPARMECQPLGRWRAQRGS